MIEGIPERSSTVAFRKEENPPRFRYSPSSIDIASENGIDIKRAKNEVKRVPTRNGSAPNSPETGFHSFPVKNLHPNVLIEGKEFKIREINMPNTSIKITIPGVYRMILNFFSLCVFTSLAMTILAQTQPLAKIRVKRSS